MSERIMNEEYENSDIQLEGLSEKEAREFKPLFTKFIKAYAKKDAAVSDKVWLAKQFREELPDLTEEAAEKMASETVEAIKEYDANLKDLNDACKQGETKEEWFAGVKALAEKLGYATDNKLFKANPLAFKGNTAKVCEFIRIALTGRKNSPDLYEIMTILGEEEIKERLK